MNAARRKKIKVAIEKINEAIEIVEEVGGEEQEAFDNLPEFSQESERGERMEEVAGELEDAAETLNDIVSILEGTL